MLESLLTGHAEKAGLKYRTITNLNAPLPPLSGQFTHQLGHGNHIYLIGSSTPTNAFCRFNLVTRQYEALSPVPFTVSAAAAVVLDDTIYYGTGYTGGTGTGMPYFYAYDIPSNTWSARTYLAANGYKAFAAAGGKVYAIGGLNTQRAFQEYDPQTNLWTAKAALPVDMYGVQAVGHEGKVLVLSASGVLYTWSPDTNAWTTGVQLLNTYYGVGMGFAHGKLYWPVNRDLYCAEDISLPSYIKQPAGEGTNKVNYAAAYLNDRVYSVLAGGTVSEFYE